MNKKLSLFYHPNKNPSATKQETKELQENCKQVQKAKKSIISFHEKLAL